MSKLAEAATAYERDELAKNLKCATCRLRAHLPEDERTDLDQLLADTADGGKYVWSGRTLAQLLEKVYGPDGGITRGSIDNHRAQGH